MQLRVRLAKDKSKMQLQFLLQLLYLHAQLLHAQLLHAQLLFGTSDICLELVISLFCKLCCFTRSNVEYTYLAKLLRVINLSLHSGANCNLKGLSHEI